MTNTTLQAISGATEVVAFGRRPWYRRPVVALMGLAFSGILAFPQAHAQAPKDGYWISPQKAAQELLVPFVELGAMDSRPGEGKNAFLLRVARVLDAFTTSTGYEGCGNISQSAIGDRFRVRLTSNRSRVACSRIVFAEDGFESLDETIHSHPRPKRFEGQITVRLNQNDSSLIGRWGCGSYVKIEDRDFSSTDRAHGTGYLVARGKLMFLPNSNAPSELVGLVDMSLPIEPLVVGGSLDHQRSALGVTTTPAWAPWSSAAPPPPRACRIK